MNRDFRTSGYAQPLFEEEELQNYRRTLDGSGPDVLTHNIAGTQMTV